MRVWNWKARAFVHCPEAADAELAGVAEAVGGLVELLVGEDVGARRGGHAELFPERRQWRAVTDEAGQWRRPLPLPSLV